MPELGEPLPDWTAPPWPGPMRLEGIWARLDPLAPGHAPALFAANRASEAIWDYLPYGPFADEAAYAAWVTSVAGKPDPLFFAVLDRETGRAGGVMSFLRITPDAGSIEVGHICLAPQLQRTRAASEAIFLLADWAFREGYRRFEWKCDALNRPSRRAAERFGFSFEGVFRQATVVKGRNRDTAWFAMTDGDWRRLRPAWQAWLDPASFDAEGRQRRRLGDLTGPCRVASDPSLGPGRAQGEMRPKGLIRRWQRRWKDSWSGRLDSPRARRDATIDMLVFDHGLVRTLWRNEAEVAPGVWRSNQPDPRAIRRLAARGLRAILNLRGATEYGSYLLEVDACRTAGIELVDVKFSSRTLPSREDILALDALFARLPKPFLMHCKSGADRSGFAAALYLLLREGADPETALRQLSWRFLHLGGGRAGVMRFMIERYAADNAREPMSFRDWVETRYDPAALAAAYRPGRIASLVADRMLRRE